MTSFKKLTRLDEMTFNAIGPITINRQHIIWIEQQYTISKEYYGTRIGFVGDLSMLVKETNDEIIRGGF